MQRDTEMILLSAIPSDLIETQDRIENWARWSRDRWRRGHCVSIEHRYKSSDLYEPPDPRVEYDALAGAELHTHVCDLPNRQRWILHLWFVHRAPPGFIRRRLAIRRDGLAHELHRAVRMLRNRLAFANRMG